MLKRILVPLDTSEFTPAATEMAVEVALQEKVRTRDQVSVLGLGLVDTEQLPSGRFAAMVPREEVLEEARHKAEELMQAFARQAQSLGMPAEQVQTQLEMGPPFRKIVHLSVFCDVIIVGQRCSFPPANQEFDTFNHLYHGASRPVLVTPARHVNVRRVVMVMDGSAPASRMMYFYAHLNPFPEAEVVLAYSRLELERYETLEGFFDGVADYLRSYGLGVRMHEVETEVEDALAELVRGEDAQAIAMGIPPETFMDKLRDPFHVRETHVQRLLRECHAALFTVH